MICLIRFIGLGLRWWVTLGNGRLPGLCDGVGVDACDRKYSANRSCNKISSFVMSCSFGFIKLNRAVVPVGSSVLIASVGSQSNRESLLTYISYL